MVRAAVLIALLVVSTAFADPLPRVGGADWPAVRARVKKLLATLSKQDALPVETKRKLETLLAEDIKDSDAALDRLQELLDPLCLVGVNINPESRVKAARGPQEASLTQLRPRIVLVRVHNEGGITAPLAVTGDELIRPDRKVASRWLEAALAPGPLSGVKLEYVVLRLTAHEAGKREATLKFDAGQGTQDLGFRADVPILFRIAR